MAFFSEVGKKITVTGQGAIQKSREMVEITKLNSQIGEFKKSMETLYLEIGKTIAGEYADAAEDEMSAKLSEEENDIRKTVLGKVLELKRLEQKILECQDQVKYLRGIVHCPNCGADVQSDALFCGKCGYKVEAEEKNNKTKICKKCGSLIPVDSAFCTNCGCKADKEFAVKICPVCGKNLDEGVIFCENCGAKVSEESVTRCPQCGRLLAEDAIFCEECGAKIQ